MTHEALRAAWKAEENCAHIQGWDFSHIRGRYEEDPDLPWDYGAVIRGVLKSDMKLLDIDTGGGEFLLSLRHPPENTSATEGYPPNVRLCEERLLPLGIDLRACSDASHIPFADAAFDIVINRHGSFDPPEIRRLLRPGGLFITQQVGADNDRELVEAVLPGAERPFPQANLKAQKKALEDAGFEILKADEAFGPICFFDVGAFVWFARVIEWEFPGFSVDRCFDRLLQMQETIERDGRIAGTTHRYFIIARRAETASRPRRLSDGIVRYDGTFFKKFDALQARIEAEDRPALYRFLLDEFSFLFKLFQDYAKQDDAGGVRDFEEADAKTQRELMRPLSYRQYRMIEQAFLAAEDADVIGSLWDFLYDDGRVYAKKVMSPAEIDGGSLILEQVYCCLAKDRCTRPGEG